MRFLHQSWAMPDRKHPTTPQSLMPGSDTIKCTGTGNFIVNRLRRIPKKDLLHMYRQQGRTAEESADYGGHWQPAVQRGTDRIHADPGRCPGLYYWWPFGPSGRGRNELYARNSVFCEPAAKCSFPICTNPCNNGHPVFSELGSNLRGWDKSWRPRGL